MLGLHALHHPRAIQVDRLDADLELLGNFPIGIALHQRQEHVPLTGREAIDARLHGLQRPGMARSPEGILNAVEQQLIVVGLFDEIAGPGLEGPHHDRHIGMAADEDHRQIDTAGA
ncbi:hypothetical protein D3C79_915890 [compost metagenome]